MASKKNKSKNENRSSHSPIWFLGVAGRIQNKGALELKHLCRTHFNLSTKGNKGVLKGRVLAAAAIVIDNYKKEWKKQMKIFRRVDEPTFHRFCRLNDNDYHMSYDTSTVMAEFDVTFKDLLINAIERNCNNITLYKMNISEEDRFNHIADQIYKQDLEVEIAEVIRRPDLDVDDDDEIGLIFANVQQQQAARAARVAANNNNIPQNINQNNNNNNNINNIPQNINQNNNNNNNINNIPQNI
eukprot:540903_1